LLWLGGRQTTSTVNGRPAFIGPELISYELALGLGLIGVILESARSIFHDSRAAGRAPGHQRLERLLGAADWFP